MMVAGLEFYNEMRSPKKKYTGGVVAHTDSENHREKVKAYHYLQSGLSPITPDPRVNVVIAKKGDWRIGEEGLPWTKEECEWLEAATERLWIAGTGGNDLRVYDFSDDQFKAKADTPEFEPRGEFAKWLENQGKSSAHVEYRKICGNTQASRWACRGCQYVGECK